MAKDQTLKIIDMQSFIGGEADNPYMGVANSCARAVGVDLRSKPGFVRLEKSLEYFGGLGEGDNYSITKLRDLGIDSDNYFVLKEKYGEDRSVLRVIGNSRYYDFPTSPNYPILVKGMCVNEGAGKVNMYYVGFKFLEQDSTTNNLPVYGLFVFKGDVINGLPENIVQLHSYTDTMYIDILRVFGFGSIGSGMGIFVMNTNSKLYIACGNKVITQDDNEIMNDDLVLPAGEVIVGMTEYLGTIKIYSVCGDDTYMYTWDGVDYLAQTRQVWKGMAIKYVGGVLNYGAYDYVLTTTGDLYLIAGTQKQKIKVSNSELNKQFNTLLSIKDDLLYIGDRKQYIYTYGTKYPGVANSLVANYKLYNNGDRPALMAGEYIITYESAIFNFGTTKYYNEEDDITRWNSKTKEWVRNSLVGGYVQSMFYTVDQWKNMAFEMMKMKVDLNIYGCVLVLYRTSVDGNWRLFKEIKNYNGEKITISIREFNEDDPGEFVGIQFMFVLQRGEGEYENMTPEIGRCTAFLREIDENI